MARPKKLQTILAEEIQKSLASTAHGFFKEAVVDKLREQGIDTDAFPVDHFVEHITAEKTESFVWQQHENEDHGRPTTVSLDFTSKDSADLSTQIHELLENVETLYQECLDSASNLLLQLFEKDWPQQKLGDDIELYGFRKRLGHTWNTPLDMFRMMLVISRELCLREAASLEKSKVRHTLYLREALLGLHARALRTATAVLVLLENGLADDAYARWRTLYELSVTAAFLSEHGEKVAEKYLAHEAVVLKKRLANELSWGNTGISEKQRRDIEKAYEAVISVYGRDFKNDYGWAAGVIDNYNPRFANIEESIKGKMIAPPYKEASLQIHSSRAGLLGLGSADDVAAIGYSNLGLDIPLMHSSLCLMQVTNLHLYHCPSRDLVILYSLMILNEKIDKQCREVAMELARDTA